MFSSGGLAPGNDYSGPYPGGKGPRADLLFREQPLRPLQMDMFNHNRPMMPNNYPGAIPTSGILGPNVPMSPLGPQVRFVLSGPELNDLVSLHNYQQLQEPDGPKLEGPSPPTPGVLSSPALGIRPHTILDLHLVHGMCWILTNFKGNLNDRGWIVLLSVEDPFFLVFIGKIKL